MAKKIFMVNWYEVTHHSLVIAENLKEALEKAENNKDFGYEKGNSGLSGDLVFGKPGDVHPEVLCKVEEKEVIDEIKRNYPEETKEID